MLRHLDIVRPFQLHMGWTVVGLRAVLRPGESDKQGGREQGTSSGMRHTPDGCLEGQERAT